MRRMPAGQWLPFEGYDLVHVCGSAPSSNSPRTHQESNVPSTSRSQNASASGYDDLEFLDFTVPGQSASESSKKTMAVTVGGTKRMRSSATPGRWVQARSDASFHAEKVPRIAAPQSVTPLKSSLKRSAVLVVVVGALVLGVAYLILQRRAQVTPPAVNQQSSERQPRPTDVLTNEPKSLTAKEYYEQGLALTKARKYAEAVEVYRQAVNLDPKMGEAHHEMGYAYTQLRQWDAAVASLKEAIVLRPDFGDSHRLLGDALSGLGKWEKSIDSYNQAITLQPDSAAAYMGLAAAQKHRNDLGAAVDAYLRVIELRPNNAVAHYELGLLYLKLGDLDAAQGQYEILLSQNQKLAEKLNQDLSRP